MGLVLIIAVVLLIGAVVYGLVVGGLGRLSDYLLERKLRKMG